MQSIETYRSELRLTKLEAMVYEMLLDVGPLPASEIAVGLDCSPNAVYRLTNHLVRRGFAVVRPEWPRIFEAVPETMVLQLVAQRNRAEQSLLQANLLGLAMPVRDSVAPQIDLLSGRQALYDRYAMEVIKAQHEVLVFAIGIAYNAQLQAIQQETRQRGVEIRHVVQRYNKDNYHIIKKWQRLGVKMRYCPSQLGFHLMVFDTQTVIISLSNPTDTDRRTSMVLRSHAAAESMRDYFYDIWSKSKLIS